MQLGEKVNLVICQKSKINDWAEHFLRYYSQYYVFNLTEGKDFNTFLESQNAGYVYGPSVGIINYELAFRRPALKQLRDFTLMLDESSMIQNETAKRSKFILGLTPRNVILLSGTPTGGKYEKLWSQLHLLGYSGSKGLYWNQYIETKILDVDGYPVKVVTGYKNVDRLKRKLKEYGAHFLKTDEVFDLPKQTEIPVMVPPAKKYRQFMRNSLVTINKLDMVVSGMETGVEVELIGDTALTKMLYARQLCGQYCKDKLQAFEDLILNTSERLIVFYNFNEELNLLHQTALKKTPNISVVNGNRKDLQAYSLYDDSITFIQYQAGAMGLNLQKANKVIYFTPPLSSELFEQSKKRIHRIGQDRPCFYYYLTCKNSIEVKIYETLKQRKDFTDTLFESLGSSDF